MPTKNYTIFNKHANPDRACLETNVTYSFTIENIHNRPLTDIMFYDVLPEGFDFCEDTVVIDNNPHVGVNPLHGFSVPTIEQALQGK